MNYATSCSNLAYLYQTLKKYSSSEKLFVESKEIFKQQLGSNHYMYGLACKNLAALYQDWKKPNQALPFLIESVEIKQKELQRNFKNLSEYEKSKYLKANQQYFNHLSKFVLSSQGKLSKEKSDSLLRFQANVFLQMKSVLLASTQKMKKRILASGDSNLIKTYQKWTDLRYQYAKFSQFSKTKLKKMQINLDSLLTQINQKEKYLSEKSEDFKTTFAPKIPTWQTLQKTMKTGEIAVEMFRLSIKNDSVIYAALLTTSTNKNAPELVILSENAVDLEGKTLRYYRKKIKAQHKDLLSYQKYWQTLDQKLKNYKTVYFSPDGVYNQINPNTLYDSDTKKYIIDKYKIQLVTNLRDKVYPNQTKSKIHKDLLIGNPSYEIDQDEYKKQHKSNKNNKQRGDEYSTELDLQKVAFTPLDGTEIEVKTITSLLKKQHHQTKIYLEADAKEEVIKQTKNPTVLHIATHGFFIQTDSKNSRKAMMNSGIAIAGITNYAKAKNKPNTEDGLLTAYEAQNLELDSTELVVLSACETGLGEVSSGEGVYGLQRAFKVAGAKTIIMSLWTVSDQATQELMTLFYKYWLKTDDKKLAFKKAQKKLKKKYKHPYFWGAFVIVE